MFPSVRSVLVFESVPVRVTVPVAVIAPKLDKPLVLISITVAADDIIGMLRVPVDVMLPEPMLISPLTVVIEPKLDKPLVLMLIIVAPDEIVGTLR